MIYTNFSNNPYFKEHEFLCKCKKCKKVYVHQELMEKITVARKESNIPFIIISGCRCPDYNKEKGGKVNSDHLTNENFICCGIDIHCRDSENRFKILKALIYAGINRIGLARTYIHAGIDKRNPSNMVWFY
jgi:hypothetical protein